MAAREGGCCNAGSTTDIELSPKSLKGLELSAAENEAISRAPKSDDEAFVAVF